MQNEELCLESKIGPPTRSSDKRLETGQNASLNLCIGSSSKNSLVLYGNVWCNQSNKMIEMEKTMMLKAAVAVKNELFEIIRTHDFLWPKSSDFELRFGHITLLNYFESEFC